MQYSRRRGRRGAKVVAVVIAALIILGSGGAFTAWRVYEHNLDPVSNSEQTQTFTVEPGTSAKDIANSLQKAGLIRAAWAFEWYVRKEDARQYLKAGSYNLRPNLSVPEIVAILTQGKVSTSLVTILPSKNLEQIKTSFIEQYGFPAAEVEAAFDPAAYADHPLLADKPADASLEGLLYPESFHKTVQTTPHDIVRASLDEMYEALTPDLRNSFAKQGLSVYQAITLASLVENEVSGQDDRKMVAQVFLRRLREDIALGSTLSPYTYDHKGLPLAPISNVSKTSLDAVAYPATSDYLFFVSGDDGRTHFSHTLEEHNALIKQYCKANCQ